MPPWLIDGGGWSLAMLEDLTGRAALALIALAVITRRLVWHKDLGRVEADRDFWRDVALRSLGVSEKMTVHAEVANEVLAAIPVPDEEG